MLKEPGAFLHRVKPCPPQSAHFKTELSAPFSSPLNYLMENTKANCSPQVNKGLLSDGTQGRSSLHCVQRVSDL